MRKTTWQGMVGAALALVLMAGCGPFGFIKGTDTDVDERMWESLSGQTKQLDFPQSTTDSFTFLFVSDIHLRPDQDDWMDVLDAYAQNADAAFILHGGDNVDRGLLKEYNWYLRRIGGFYAYLYPAIGNHDLYNNGWEHYQRLLGPSVYSFEYGNAFFFFLDSAQATLGRDQLDYVERKLKRVTQRHRFVISHFPIYDGPVQTPAMLGVPEERYKLIYLFDEYGVEYYLSGHKHSGERYQIRDCWYIIAGAGSTYKDILDDQPHFWRFDIRGPTIHSKKIYFKDLR